MGILEKVSILSLCITLFCLINSTAKIINKISNIEKRIERDEYLLGTYIAKVERSTTE